MNRRDFLSIAALTTAAGATGVLRPIHAADAHGKLGIQLFSVPKMLADDFAGTFKFLAGLGYSEVEFFGPYDFSTDKAKAFWKQVAPMVDLSPTDSGFYGKTTKEVRGILDQNGLAAASMHTDLDTLQNAMGPLAEAAHALGAKYVALPALLGQDLKTLDDYKRIADDFNKIGASALSHGVRFAYHNHGEGWTPIQGQVPMPLLFKETDPKKVFLEMDIFWTTAAGLDPIQLLREHPGRYKEMHVKDMKTIKHFKGDDMIAEIKALFPEMVPAGDGAMDLKGIIAQAKKSGVEHFFIEQDRTPNPKVDLKRSADYTLKLV